MEHMIIASIFFYLFHSCHIPRILHHTDSALVPRVIRTDRARITVGKIASYRAVGHSCLGIANGICQCKRILIFHGKDMKSKTLRCFPADARQLGKLVDQLI